MWNIYSPPGLNPVTTKSPNISYEPKSAATTFQRQRRRLLTNSFCILCYDYCLNVDNNFLLNFQMFKWRNRPFLKRRWCWERENILQNKKKLTKTWHSCEGNSSVLQIRLLYLPYDVITTFFKCDFRIDLYFRWTILSWPFCFTRTRGDFQFLNCGGGFFVVVIFLCPLFPENKVTVIMIWIKVQTKCNKMEFFTMIILMATYYYLQSMTIILEAEYITFIIIAFGYN